MDEFHFLRPAWFWLLPPLAMLLAWLWRQQLRSRSWQSVCDAELLPYLLLGRSRRRRNWPIYLMALALLLAITALAGPAWERLPQPLFRQQSALVVLLDLSASMYASDLKPNRLVRARLKIADILQQRREGQTALVVFAGEAFTVTPLTDDSKTILALLDSLEPGLMPVFGSRPELALQRGRELLQQAGLPRGDLLLVTDDDQPDEAIAAAEDLQKAGYRLSVLGVGTREGAPIPLAEGGFFEDASGELVLPQLKPARLKQLAAAGGGSYRSIRVDDLDIQQLLSLPLQERLSGEHQQSRQQGDRWREAGVWLLWPLTLLAACAFRRGWLTLIIFCCLLPAPAQAIDWAQLWQRPDQRGAAAFAQGDYATAKELFEDHRWQASALYRNGQYAEAVKLLAEPESAADYYNLGNALAQSGRLMDALQAYNQALQRNPQDPDALANKQLIEELLEQQQQQQQQEQQEQQQQRQQADPQGKQQNQSRSAADGRQQARQHSAPSSAEEQQNAPGQRAEPSSQPQESLDSAQPEAGEEKEPAQPGQMDEKSLNQTAQPGESAEPSADSSAREEERASQQWLQRVPDDPGGLLRRKFLYQYRQRERRMEADKPW